MKLEIIVTKASQKHTIKNLWVYYLYDLSLVADKNDDLALNRYGIVWGREFKTHDQAMAVFDTVWSKPGFIIPMLFYIDKLPVGFAIIVTKPYVRADLDYELHEFFVMNKFRKQGMGEEAFRRIIRKYRGVWELGYLKKNKQARLFWGKAIKRHAYEFRNKVIPAHDGLPELTGIVFNSRKTGHR